MVVNIGASYGLHVEKGMPAFNVAYEHGVVAFTRSIALTSADDGVRVHCVCPGAVETKNAKYVIFLSFKPSYTNICNGCGCGTVPPDNSLSGGTISKGSLRIIRYPAGPCQRGPSG